MNYTCSQVKMLLDTYLDNMTNQLETDAIEKHLQECAECRSELDFLNSIIDLEANFPVIDVSEDFESKLHQNLIVARNKKQRVFLTKFTRNSLAFLSAAAVIAISVVSFNSIKDKSINETQYISESTISPDYAKSNSEEIAIAIDETSVSSAKPQENTQNKQNSANREMQHPDLQKSTTNNPKAKLADSNMQNEPALANDMSRTAFAVSENIAEPTLAPVVEETMPVQTAAPIANVKVPDKIKVIAIVTTKDGDNTLAKQMLSGYTFENGTYVLSSAEYQNVLGKLDEMGASISIARENKTSRYAELTSKLQTANSSDATSIKNELNAIDSEIAKKYIILN